VVVEFRPRRRAELAAGAGGRASPRLAGWVGRSDAWCTAVRAVVPAVAGRRGVVVSGESGTGKLSLLRCAAIADGASPVVFDAALEAIDGTSAWVNEVRAALGNPARPVILRHVELLSEPAAQALAAVVETDASTAPAILGVTVCGTLETLPLPVRSLVRRVAPVTIDVPPLRHRREDVRELVAHFTAGRRRWTPPALQLVVRQDWPDNVRELQQLVESVCAVGCSREVVLDDLPPDIRARSARRSMSRIEEVGLVALLAALREAGGNKARAAEILGVSRSTVYRKLASGGFDVDHRGS
jgi:DNA-binding transcriptional ArsR family regulator